jgi:hypothetical protein
MIGVRKLLDYVFTKEELKILDDILPEFKRRQKLEIEEAVEKEVSCKTFLFLRFFLYFVSAVEKRGNFTNLVRLKKCASTMFSQLIITKL